jgi:YD repeat-containing protein
VSVLRIARLLAAAALLAAPAAAYAQASASPYTSAVRYDPAGRTTGTIAPDSDGGGPIRHAAVRNSYNDAGWLTKVETGELASWQSQDVVPTAWPGFTVFRTLETVYDAMGRKTRDTLREGPAGPVRTITDYSYDELGRLECTAVRMNLASPPTDACTPGSGGSDRITKTIYDAAGQRLQLRVGVGIPEVEGAEATWAYNLNGQVTTIIDGNGNRAELRYDRHGRQDRWTFPSTTRPASYDDTNQATALGSAGSVNAADYEAYSYDPNGNRTNLRKRDNRNIAFAYDALNRVAAKTYPDGGARPVYYGYDLRNLQLTARFDSQSGEGITSTYDGFGRVVSSSTNMGGTTRTLTYAYNAHGARTQITHPDGIFFGTLLDALDRPYYSYDSVSAPIAYYTYMPFGTLDHSGHGAYGTRYPRRPSSLRAKCASIARRIPSAICLLPSGELIYSASVRLER